MAEGTVTGTNRTRTILVLENRTSTSSAPTLATDGVSLKGVQRPDVAALSATVVVYATASGAGSAMVRVWLYFEGAAVWCPAGIGADADKGKVNDATALGETSTDVIAHSQPMSIVGTADRIYYQLTTATNIARLDAWLVVPKNTVER